MSKVTPYLINESNSLIDKLTTIKDIDIEQYTLNNINTVGKIVDIYDGDTCRIVLLIDNKLIKFNCRLIDLDTPEMKPSLTKPNREQEILNAHKCRNRLLQLLTNSKCELNSIMKKQDCQKLLDVNTKLIYVKCHEFDKYGRLLVHLFPNENDTVSVNQILIDEGLAKQYNGGTKDIFTY
jgi:endonuclease YncB( thermonuclease family)